ncbi:MAG: hypothetical protein WC856_02225 [Methylococcaceae bacterium]|jgi:hypothetical protein
MAREIDVFSFEGLKKLNEDELLDRLEQVDNQATLIRWRILLELRRRFSSDQLFGQYLNNLRASRTICSSIPKKVTREIHAGRFCEKHNIISLEQIGCLKQTIYDLSAPKNADISDEVFRQVKKKSLPINEVQRLINQAKSITVASEHEQEESIDTDYDEDSTHGKYTIQVIEGIAIEPEKDDRIDIEDEPEEPEDDQTLYIEQIAEIVEEEIEQDEPVKPMALAPQHKVIMVDGIPKLQVSTGHGNNAVYRRLLIEELSKMDMSNITEEQAIHETLTLWKSYGLAAIRQVPIAKGIINKLSEMTYHKKVM